MVDCSRKKIYSPSDKGIVFGNGGGFTGSRIEYCIEPNGLILNKEADVFHKNNKIPNLEAKAIFAVLDSLSKNDSLLINQPGNHYKYIKYQDRQWIWGSADQKPDSLLLDIYQKMNELIIKKVN